MVTETATTKVMQVDRGRVFGLNSLGFLVVTLVAYFSALITMGYVRNTFGVTRVAGLVGLSVAYLLNGVFGYAWARKADSIVSSLVYIAIQIGIGTAVLFLAMSPVIIFAMLPIVGQAVVLLPRRLMFAACSAMWLAFVVPMTIFSGWRPAAVPRAVLHAVPHAVLE